GHPSAGKPRRLITSSPKIPHSSMFGGKLFKQFVADPRPAIFFSALLGAVIGYGIGWSVVRKFGLPHSATPYDVDAAADRAKQGQH
ncbi:hypothetical protein, partial [Bradyrhizobium sp. Mp64]|uniref:hypothetical protein n=1 Tax=Bradyrhizobium sp. Mp64 TaxID=3042158 RepID=UPI00248C6245